MSRQQPVFDKVEALRTGDLVRQHIPAAPLSRAGSVKEAADFLKDLRPYDPNRDAVQVDPRLVPQVRVEGLDHVPNSEEVAIQTARRLQYMRQTQIDASMANAHLAATPLPPQPFNAGGELN